MRAASRQKLPEPAAKPWEVDLVAAGMAKWRRERRDIDCSGKSIVGRVLRLQALILRTVNTALARHGVKYPVYAVLVTLRVQGPPYRMSPSLLGATLLLSSGGLSILLRRIEEKGLVRRKADARDGRGVIVELTDKGFALADAAMVDHAAAERELVAAVPEEDQEVLIRCFSLMADVRPSPRSRIAVLRWFSPTQKVRQIGGTDIFLESQISASYARLAPA
jgi:DNA-binding MarR family transcriptional regulator